MRAAAKRCIGMPESGIPASVLASSGPVANDGALSSSRRLHFTDPPLQQASEGDEIGVIGRNARLLFNVGKYVLYCISETIRD